MNQNDEDDDDFKRMDDNVEAQFLDNLDVNDGYNYDDGDEPEEEDDDV